MNYRKPELQQRLAAEYVLGTLQGPARRRFERLLVEDRALQQLVQVWERRLAPWLAAVPAQPVPPEVWQRIRERRRRNVEHGIRIGQLRRAGKVHTDADDDVSTHHFKQDAGKLAAIKQHVVRPLEREVSVIT